MIHPKEYRIRVGKLFFKMPHYISSISTDNEASVQMITVNKNPIAWKTKVIAERKLKFIKEQYPSAEIEIHYLD